jgi:hypothetical protein
MFDVFPTDGRLGRLWPHVDVDKSQLFSNGWVDAIARVVENDLSETELTAGELINLFRMDDK